MHISSGNCFITAFISRNFQNQIATQKAHFGRKKIPLDSLAPFFVIQVLSSLFLRRSQHKVVIYYLLKILKRSI